MSEVIEQSAAEHIDALIAVEAEICRLQAEKLRLVAAVVGDARDRSTDDIDKHWAREELACALRLSGVGATNLMVLALNAARLPNAMSMLEKGQLSLTHVRVLADACGPHPDGVVARIEARALRGAEELSVASFRRRVDKAVMAIAPQDAQQAHEAAMTERRVEYRPVNAGMAEIWALLPATGALTVMHALSRLTDCPETRVDPKTGIDPDAITNPDAPDPRSAHQRRADALVQLATCALAGVPATTTPVAGARPHIQVTVAASTLAGLDDHPADLDGHGPIPAGLACTIAADPTSRWRRLLLDDAGQLIDYGRTTYRPPVALADHVAARDRVCQFVNCNRPAIKCELDHVDPFGAGGETNADNLCALCARHHHLKHEAPGWALTRNPDGTTTWTTPTGHTYTTGPDPYELPNDPVP